MQFLQIALQIFGASALLTGFGWAPRGAVRMLQIHRNHCDVGARQMSPAPLQQSVGERRPPVKEPPGTPGQPPRKPPDRPPPEKLPPRQPPKSPPEPPPPRPPPVQPPPRRRRPALPPEKIGLQTGHCLTVLGASLAVAVLLAALAGCQRGNRPGPPRNPAPIEHR
jgi:hypothetical protein